MVNLTPDSIVFNVEDALLDGEVRKALALAARTSLSIHGLDDLDLSTVTTKTNIRGVFAKFVEGRLLGSERRSFGKAYVNAAFAAYREKTGHLTKTQFDAVMSPAKAGPFSYKASYAVSIRPGVGLFLVALHSSGAITLPVSFHWPFVRRDEPQTGAGRRREVGKLVASELLAFIRTLDSQSDAAPHPAFNAIARDRKRQEWFLTYATKLLLATGWHRPEDVNLEDLLAIKAAEKTLSPNEAMPLAYKALLDVLVRAFGGRVTVTTEDWSSALRKEVAPRAPRRKGQHHDGVAEAFHHLFKDGPRNDRDLLQEVLHIGPMWGRPDELRTLERLPGLAVDLPALTRLWLDLEDLYVQKTARESYKAIYTALGWWNVYLFYYLPYWFSRNASTGLTFPSSPSLLTKSVFVSRLLASVDPRPITFIEFMNAQSEHREWKNNGYYSILLQLQSFFEFIERYSDEMPGCEQFTQPFSPHDYPRTSRTKASKKQPVPRRLFGIYVDYHEALLAHHGVVTKLALSGELDSDSLKKLTSNGRVIDTFATWNMVGFVPVLFTATRTIPLQFIPNVLDLRWRTMRDGRSMYLPHPHGVHQNLVALHTGLRHNHIQWLDKEKFDSFVDDGDTDFALLFVNTDKQKTVPWTPHVCMRVIEVLQAQRDWSRLIGEDGFDAVHFYNDNNKTKWPKFRPLFAYTAEGKPHGDSVYTSVWQDTLCGLQGLLPSLSEYGRTRELLRLLPAGMRANDPELHKKLLEYGSRFGAGDACLLNVMTSTTPHSARVAVVSQYITFLPTDLIGKYITGQTPGVVPYYVHLDRETIEAEQVHQAARMRDAALRTAFEPVLHGAKGALTFIHADNVNSNLARSMKMNLDEAIVSYGGMSISFTERSKRGVDILRETKGIDAAFNKTEICPYGNSCPPHVVQELKGLRRCSLCPFAVRTIDHLPAVLAKKRQVADAVDELESLLSTDARTLNAKYTPEELDEIEAERARACEDLVGWVLNEEVLEVTRQRIAAGQDSRTWVVQRPEMLERDLQRVAAPSSGTEYLLARLGECIAFPALASPQVRARFDLLRRELLARAGKLRLAFAPGVPVDPAAECAGMLKSVIAATGMTVMQLADMLERETHLADIPNTSLRLLTEEEAA